jgi:dienelactone hydrolase
MTPVDNGYLATPTTNIGNPVLVLHAWWGLNDTIKRFCDQLAEAGFVAYAPDLYRGQVTDQIDEAEKLAGSLDEHAERARADVDAGVSLLKERMGASYAGIAVIGFSLGAFYALDLSARDPDNIHSVVIYYGAGPADFTRGEWPAISVTLRRTIPTSRKRIWIGYTTRSARPGVRSPSIPIPTPDTGSRSQIEQTPIMRKRRPSPGSARLRF